MSSSQVPGIASSETLRVMWEVALRDIQTLFKTPWIIISRGLSFIIQIFVFAVLISELVTISELDFFGYYAVGSVISTIASIAFLIGYDIYEEAEEGVLDYLLTLPISRRQFIVSRGIGGASRAMLYVLPMFAVITVLQGFSNPLGIFLSIVLLFLLAFGITALSITIAVAVRSANRFDVVLALLELAIVRASTALYPLAFMPSYVAAFAPYSPVTFAADAVRGALGSATLELTSIAGLLAFVAVFVALGATFYLRKLEGGTYA